MNRIAETYEQDFYAWAIHNAELLRQGRLSEIDVEHIAEELECMGRSEKRELMSRLGVLLAHLLKWVYQPYRRSRSWRAQSKPSAKTSRHSLKKALASNPNWGRS